MYKVHSRVLVPRAADVDYLALSPRGTVGCLRITALTALICPVLFPARPLSYAALLPLLLLLPAPLLVPVYLQACLPEMVCCCA